jgi:primosomal protein N' (replication factor Y)
LFVRVALLRPQRGDFFLTYSVPPTLKENIKKGDIVEVPFRNNRENAVIFDLLSAEQVFPDGEFFETKNIGKIIHSQFFPENFLDFFQKISDYFFCSPSFFLAKAAPLNILQTPENLLTPPQEKFYKINTTLHIKRTPKQQALAEVFTKKNPEISEQKLKKLFSTSVIKTAVQKEILQEIWKEKFVCTPVGNRHVFPVDVGDRHVCSLPEDTDQKHKILQKHYFDFSRIPLDSQKNIFLGSNHSSKNLALLQWILDIIKQEKQVAFIFPEEISLTQAYEKFQKIFPKKWIEKYSSSLGKNAKHELFFKITTQTKILLGTKNALFLKYKNLGGIIVHEYDNPLYISHISPFTHAKDIAKIRAQSQNIPLILESTAGDIDEIFEISQKKTGTITKFSQQNAPHVQVVNMNLERLNNNPSPLSLTLETAIKNALAQQKQSLIFLNRKGMFTSLFCSECKWTPISPLTGNKMRVFKTPNGEKMLRCNASKYHEKFPEKCPKCQKNALVEVGQGTQGIEEILMQKFPSARIFRVDKDALSSSAKTRNFLEKMKNKEIDIIIGTQLLLQSFPFPNVEVIGNIITENDILFPSFKAEEKAFLQNAKLQDLGSPSAQVYLQTFCPEHPFIQKIIQASANRFDHFFQSELSARKYLYYPPFSTALEISKSAKTQKTLEKNFTELQNIIRPLCEKIFPIHFSYQAQRNLFTAKMLIFTEQSDAIWEKISGKNVTINRYSE